MYVPPVFKVDETVAWTFVAERGFGTVVAMGPEGPVASHVPLLASEDESGKRIAFHVARANPLHTLLVTAPRVLVIVTGPDSYISPDWYVSENQVPTWNYVSVHINGTARTLPPTDAQVHVAALSDVFEQRLLPKPPWTIDKMAPTQLDRMLRAIVPIEVLVKSVEGQWKLGQHKSPADQAGVLAALEQSTDCARRALADMIRSRPVASGSSNSA